MRLPDFLGLGVQKGGTTYLHALLQQHPQVFLATPKEQQFFSLQWGAGVPGYAARFAAAAPQQRCGEITPYYVFHPLAPQRIQAVLPGARLIVLLRDPVERALSQYFHSRRLGLETLELEAALAAEPQRLAGSAAVLEQGQPHRSHQQHSYLSRSRYAEQLERFQALFPAEQLLILRSEALFSDPQPQWERILEFLALDRMPCPTLAPVYAGAGESQSVPVALREQLRQQLVSTYRWMEEVLP